MVLLSSGERMDGLGSKWVMWRLPGNREKDSFWCHSVGVSAVKAAVQTPVMVYAWNGNKKVTCLSIYRSRCIFLAIPQFQITVRT